VALGKQASIQPVAQVAKAYEVSHLLVQHSFKAVAKQEVEQKGLCVNEQQKLATPRFLGIDKFARRKGHVYETILCDLETR
jgi:hypothetical protein